MLKHRGVDTYNPLYTILRYDYEDFVKGSKVFLTQQTSRAHPPLPPVREWVLTAYRSSVFGGAHALYAGTYACRSPTQSNPGVVY